MMQDIALFPKKHSKEYGEEDQPTLKIPVKRYTGETSVTSIRLPKDMLAAIEEVAVRTGRTRNEVMQLGLEFALKHIDIEDKGE